MYSLCPNLPESARITFSEALFHSGRLGQNQHSARNRIFVSALHSQYIGVCPSARVVRVRFRYYLSETT